jgi:hypothetical protein
MRGEYRLLVAAVALCVFSQQAHSLVASDAADPAQSTTATPGNFGDKAQPGSAEKIQLGESAVGLTGPWRFHIGDDMAWAKPDFDDSTWEKVDLAALAQGRRGEIPGWTALGHRGYSGYAWYRLKVDVEGGKRPLALKMPSSADDAYQVFVNGNMVGEFGKFTEHGVTAYGSIPLDFPIPKDLRNGQMTIAIRMWMDSATVFNSPDAGGMHAPPFLGFASAIAAQVRLDFDDIAHAVGSGFLEDLILIMALLMAATLLWYDPSEKAYFWLALVCAVTLFGNSIVQLANFTTPVGQTTGVILYDVVATPIRIGLWVVFWAYWFRTQRINRLHYAVWTLVPILALATAMLRPPLYGQTIPVQAAKYIVPVQLFSKLGLGVLLFAVAYFGFTRRKGDRLLAPIALVLAFIANFQHELRLIHLTIRTSVFGFVLTLGQISTIVSLLIITIMLLRRFIYSQRKQEQWKLEIEQARHVQQILIPDKLPVVEGMAIESEYRPAREVGGDFFQILPGDTPGTAMIVVGDVTGKGLQAGMLVALIVGALRSAFQNTSDPSQILNSINDQLCEREHSSATCLILRIDQDGTVTLSSAGQLPPYLNGKEMELEGALPMGIIGGMEYSSASFKLSEGDSLVLMSDGIAEAQDSRGKLFGFDRVQQMLLAQSTPAEIAAAAQQFGQEDDILVLEIRWTGSRTVDALAKPQLAAY